MINQHEGLKPTNRQAVVVAPKVQEATTAPSITETKPGVVVKSKINIVQGAMALLAVLCDPSFAELHIIPLEYLPKLVLAGNALTFVLRAFFSCPKVVFKPGGVE